MSNIFLKKYSGKIKATEYDDVLAQSMTYIPNLILNWIVHCVHFSIFQYCMRKHEHEHFKYAPIKMLIHILCLARG